MNAVEQAYWNGVKRAQDASDLAFFQPRKNKPIRGMVSRLVYGDSGGADEKTFEDAVKILEILRRKYPDALRDTSIHVGRPSLDNLLSRMSETQDHDTALGRFLGNREVAASQMALQTDAGLEQFPSSYHPYGDFAVLPEGSPGVALHELGHAIDLNKPFRRREDGKLRGQVRRAGRVMFKPTLLQELSAWNKAEKGLARGAKPDEEEFVRRILAEAYKRRKPALGTYVGAGAGSLLGMAGGGLLAAALESPELLPTGMGLGGALGAALGIPAGAGIGRLVGSDRRAERYADRKMRRHFPAGPKSESGSEDKDKDKDKDKDE